MTQDTATTLRLTERIAAPQFAVFDFLVDPEKMLRWMGTEVRIDPRPGGQFWINATGTTVASGKYLEVDPPNRVVFTWGWEDNAEIAPGSSTVSITLTTDGADTVVELVHSGLPNPDAATSHKSGWTHFVGRLSAVAEGREPGPIDPPHHPEESEQE